MISRLRKKPLHIAELVDCPSKLTCGREYTVHFIHFTDATVSSFFVQSNFELKSLLCDFYILLLRKWNKDWSHKGLQFKTMQNNPWNCWTPHDFLCQTTLLLWTRHRNSWFQKKSWNHDSWGADVQKKANFLKIFTFYPIDYSRHSGWLSVGRHVSPLFQKLTKTHFWKTETWPLLPKKYMKEKLGEKVH